MVALSLRAGSLYIPWGGGASVSDKLYALNKAMASVDLFYQVELPDIFTFDHPLGSVMGRASYSDYFTFSQGCTVGNNRGIYPRFGQSVFMLSDSKVIGDCEIGSNVIIGATAYERCGYPQQFTRFRTKPESQIKENRARMRFDCMSRRCFAMSSIAVITARGGSAHTAQEHQRVLR